MFARTINIPITRVSIPAAAPLAPFLAGAAPLERVMMLNSALGRCLLTVAAGASKSVIRMQPHTMEA